MQFACVRTTVAIHAYENAPQPDIETTFADDTGQAND